MKRFDRAPASLSYSSEDDSDWDAAKGFLLESVTCITSLVLDSSIDSADEIAEACERAGGRVIRFQFDTQDKLDALVQENTSAETRVLLGPRAAEDIGIGHRVVYLLPEVSRTSSITRADPVPLRTLRVLHLVGSCASDLYEGISRLYAEQCIESLSPRKRFSHMVAYVHQDGSWSLSKDGNIEALLLSNNRMSPGSAIDKISALKIDVVQPHMFDYDGMTAFRSLFTVLQIPILGCTGDALALSTHKQRTKAVASAAGVKVPRSETISMGMKPKMPRPYVLKPVEEDNSQGVSVVMADTSEEELEKMLEDGFKFGDLLCEEFIALGRELRVAIFENSDGTMDMLPVLEYHLSEKTPIRTPENKFSTINKEEPLKLATGGRTMDTEVDDKLRDKLFEASKFAHTALGCRDYSIFDYRIDQTGIPFLLETCLYCSFAPASVIVSMQRARGMPNYTGFERLAERAVARRRS